MSRPITDSDKIRDYKAELTRKNSIANKRLKRLKEAGLAFVPAYRNWENNGGIKFSVKGLDWNGLQQENARVTNFLNMETSTMKGAKEVIRTTAARIGLQLEKKFDLEKTSAILSNYFRLIDKIEQMLKLKGDFFNAIEYEALWNSTTKFFEGDSEYSFDMLGTATDEEIDNLAGIISGGIDYKDLNKAYKELSEESAWFSL